MVTCDVTVILFVSQDLYVSKTANLTDKPD